MSIRDGDPVSSFGVGCSGEDLAELRKVGNDEGESVGGKAKDVDGVAFLRSGWEGSVIKRGR